MEVGGHGGAALDQHLQHVAPAELVEDRRRGRRDISRAGWTRLSSAARPRTTRSGSRPAACAYGEGRIVGPHRAGADQHGVALGPQAVGVGPGQRAGDPLAGAVGRRRAPVEGGRQLEHDPGPARSSGASGRGPAGRATSSAHTPTETSTPASRSRSMPAPRTRGSGSSMPTTTRRTPAAIRASAHGGVRPWWQHGSRVTYDRRAPGTVAGQGQGGRLGVGAARGFGGADDRRRVVAGDDHAADPWVGRGRRRAHRRPR